MNTIHSENELLPSGISFGQWKFTLSDGEMRENLESFTKVEGDPTDECVHWINLFSLVTNKEDVKTNEESSTNNSAVCVIEDEPMEISTDIQRFVEDHEIVSGVSSSGFEDVIVSLVDICNPISKNLKPGSFFDEEELAVVVQDLQKLDESLLHRVVEISWPQLDSDASKLRFCVVFCVKSEWFAILCNQALVPWFSKSLPSKLEHFSEIFSKQGEVFCTFLMSPLLKIEDSPLVKDLLSVEEIMTHMSKKHWNTLLHYLLDDLRQLYSWIIPVLAMVVEHSEPSLDELSVLIQLMSSAGSNCSNSRDFGALLVAVAISIKPGFSSVSSQMKLITNNYKGPLKFKVLKVLNDIKD